MKIIKNKLIPFGRFAAITLGPLIFTKKDSLSDKVIRHEAIHWEQYKELLIVFFLPLYVIMYVWEYVRCLINPARGTYADGHYRPTWQRAYYSIALEREAYNHQSDPDYINKRKHFSWIFS